MSIVKAGEAEGSLGEVASGRIVFVSFLFLRQGIVL